MKNKPLARQLFYFFLAFSLFLLALLWLFQTVLLNESYQIIREKEVDQAIKVVGQHINSEDLDQVLEDLENQKKIRVEETRFFQAPLIIKDFLDLDSFPHSLMKTHSYVLKDGSRLSLTFYALLSPMEPVISTLRYQLVLVSLIMLFLSILGALYLSKQIARPLVKISDQAKLLSLGYYQEDFRGGTYLEVEELAQTLNQAAHDLSRVEDQRREVLAHVSHDLRTPLSLIYSQAEIMTDFPEERTGDRLQVVLDETKRLTRLVNDLIAQAQLDKKDLALDIKDFDLKDSFEKTTYRVQEMVKDRGYTIQFTSSGPCPIKGDEDKLTQAYYNLLANALAYSDPDQAIKVNLENLGSFVRITVKDQGQGIREDDLPHIFKAYYRARTSQEQAPSGSGLGLSIVKKIVDLHGGRVSVQSQYKKGSSFTIELPVHP